MVQIIAATYLEKILNGLNVVVAMFGGTILASILQNAIWTPHSGVKNAYDCLSAVP